jgi:hypothetical protein
MDVNTHCRSLTGEQKEAENEMVEHLNTCPMDFLAARSAFLDHFADKTKPYYQSISRLYHHPDGVYSKGYMWEVLTPTYVIHYAKALELLASHERILVLADILKPSAVYPLRVPAVSVTSGAKLCEALDYGKIPPPYGNLYVFDDTYTWYVALTTEYERRLHWGDASEAADFLCMTSPGPISQTEGVFMEKGKIL